MGWSRWVLLGGFVCAVPGVARAQATAGFPSAPADGAAPATSAAAPSPEPATSQSPPVTQPAQAPPEPPPPAPAATPWGAAYAHARALLLDGHFAEAQAEFATLARSAPTPVDRDLAVELANIAATWQARDVKLVASADLEASAIEARRQNRRTTDEISVLYLNGVLYGLGSGGVIAVHSQPKSPAGVVLPALLLGGAGAAAVAGLDHLGLGYGVPQSIVSGMYLGLGEGIVWSVWNQAHVRFDREWREQTIADVIWASATVGAIAGGAISSVYGATPGRASYVTSAALWTGVLAGGLTAAVVKDDYRADDNALLSAAIGLNAGAILGVLTAGEVSPSIARVRFLDLGGLAGTLVFGGLYVSAADKNMNPQTAFATATLGTAAGLGLAWYLTKDMPRDRFTKDAPAGSSGSSGSSALAILPVRGGGQLAAYGTF